MRMQSTSIVVFLCLALGVGLWAQGRTIGPDWPAAHADAQLTSWQRFDPNISVERLSQPGFELQWKERLTVEPRGLNALGTAVTINGVNLFMPVSLVTAADNRIIAIDNDTGFPLWQRRFDGALPPATAACPGGITGAAARVINVAPPAPVQAGAGGRGGARGGGYRGAVGAPGEGAPVEPAQRGGGAGGGRAGIAGRPAGAAAPAPAAAPGGRGAGGGAPAPARGGGGGLGRLGGPGYVIAADGVLHTVGWLSGIDIQKPAQVLPAGARFSDALAVDNVLYVTTSKACGSAESAVWAIDLASEARSARSWRTNGGDPVGSVAFTPDGTLIVAIGAGQAGANGYANAIVALDPKTLQPKDWFTHRTAEFVSAPVVFRHGSRDVIAAATRDGRVLLVDARSPGGANHATPLASSQPLVPARAAFAPGALAVWQEIVSAPAAPGPGAGATPAPEQGVTWLLAPVTGSLGPGARVPGGAPIANGAVVALRVVDRGGRPSMRPGWVSRDLVGPLTPITVNGVVFAAASGRSASSGAATSAPDQVSGAKPAVLYAFDGRNGKELWNSGQTMTSFMSTRSLWSSNSQVHVGTHDGTIYAFGFTLERR